MRLEGSCHCGAVRFSLESEEPYPFMRCYCSICRKTAGGGGYAINLGGAAHSLKVTGRKALSVYHAKGCDGCPPGEASPAERNFCKHCGAALWVYDPRWPELIHPFASAIDTPLPVPPESQHILLKDKAPWVEPAVGPHDRCFEAYPEESLAEWHQRRGLAMP